MTRALSALLLLAGTTALAPACRKHALPTTTLQVGEHRMLVEVADDGEERARGLMNRDSLPADEGMLFVYPAPKELSFWMKNTRIPLSIAYIQADGTIATIADMRPMSSKSVLSGAPCLYALEVNQGWFEAHGVSVGDKVGGLPGPSEH